MYVGISDVSHTLIETSVMITDLATLLRNNMTMYVNHAGFI